MDNKNDLKQPIILVGFMGTGKTTLGKYYAEKQNKTFVDLDDLIQRKTNKTIPAIFRDYGEGTFREFEYKYLQEVVNEYDVISTGGGIIESELTKRFLSKMKNVIWLDTDIEIIYQRIKNDYNRPNASNKGIEDLKRLYLTRVSRYNEIAFSKLETNVDLDELYQKLNNLVNADDQY